MITLLHILSGSLAILAATLAIAAPKGRPLHIAAGKIFLAAMLTTALTGAGLGFWQAETHLITGFAGILAAYLVVTGWRAARGGNRTGLDWAAMVIIGANTALLILAGLYALGDFTGQAFGFPAEDYFFLAGMSGLAGAADGLWLLRRSPGQRARIARHLWRMCLAFFMAAGSLFTGPGAVVFPASIQASGLLVLPELLILIALAAFLIRTLWFSAPVRLPARRAAR